MFDMYSKGKLYVYSQNDKFILVSTIVEVDEYMVLCKILDTNMEEFEGVEGESIILDKSALEIVVNPKQIIDNLRL